MIRVCTLLCAPVVTVITAFGRTISERKRERGRERAVKKKRKKEIQFSVGEGKKEATIQTRVSIVNLQMCVSVSSG